PGYPQPGYGGQPGYPQPGYPQPGGGQPGYPQPGAYGMPAYPGAAGGYRPDPGPPPARPSTVTAAFYSWMGVMVASIVGTVILLTGDYVSDLLSATPGLDEDLVQAAVSFAKV